MSDTKVAYVRFVVGDFGDQFHAKKIVYSDINANSWLTPVGIRPRRELGPRVSKPPKINSVIQKSIQERAQSAAAIMGHGRCNSERGSLEKEVLRGKSLNRPMTADSFPVCQTSRTGRTPLRTVTQSDSPGVTKEWVALNIQPILAPRSAKGDSGEARTAEQRRPSVNAVAPFLPVPPPQPSDFRSFDEMKRGLESRIRSASTAWDDEKPVTPKPAAQEVNGSGEAPPVKYFRAPLRPLLYTGEPSESVRSVKSRYIPFKACLASDDYFVRLADEKQRAEEQIRRSRRIISAHSASQLEQRDLLREDP